MSKIVGKYIDSSMFVKEAPSGTINGVNTSFSLAQTPIDNAIVTLSLNGIILVEGGTDDYTLSGTTITMNTAPASGQELRAEYFAK